MNRMYTVNDQTNMRFLQLPKSLFENNYYKEMSLGAKTMYAVLRDRQDLSIANKWVDNNGFIFFYYDVNNMAEYLNVSTSTVNRYKKELHKFELLVEHRQGLNKPNRLYILKPESIENAWSSQNDYSRIANMINQEVSKSLSNDTEIKETEKKDTELLLDFSKKTLALYNFLSSYCFEKFNKPIRQHNNIIDLDDMYDIAVDGLDDFYSFIDRRINSYDRCNLDYLDTIKADFSIELQEF